MSNGFPRQVISRPVQLCPACGKPMAKCELTVMGFVSSVNGEKSGYVCTNTDCPTNRRQGDAER